MIKNYFKIMMRYIGRNKLYTFINVFGISVSLACCILLFLYATRELSYDLHHGPNTYRITTDISQQDGNVFHIPTTSIPVGPVAQEQVSEIQYAARATNSGAFGAKNLVKYGSESWFIENLFIVDTTFYDILTYDFIYGNPQNPLPHNKGIVLEKSISEKMFGKENPVGKTLSISTMMGKADFEVTSVYDKRSLLNHVNPDMVMLTTSPGWNDFFNQFNNNWIGNNLVVTYLKLYPGSDPDVVDSKIHELLLTYGGEMMKETGLNKEMDLQPIEDIHTSQGYMIDVYESINPVFIHVLIIIGILILILACVNYINLSTAKAGSRALEVSIRKVMGINRSGLVFQFLGESFVIVFISLMFSLLLAWMILPYFNLLISNPIAIDSRYAPILAIFFAGFLLFTGVVAGLYPAFYLASFKPANILKGKNKDKTGTSLIRKGLVVFQFIISICLISAIIIISEQIEYVKSKDLGFNSKSKVVVNFNTEDASSQYGNIKNSYRTLNQVTNVSGADGIPGFNIINDILVYPEGKTMDDAVHVYNNTVDIGFAELLDIPLISGHFFTDYDKDSLIDPIVMSLEGIRQLGLDPQEAVGERVYFNWQGTLFTYEIRGVFSDIHQFSLHKPIDPIMFTIGNENKTYQYMVIDAQTENFQDLITAMETEWKKLIPDTPFTYFTLEEQLLQQYQSDMNTSNLIRYFAIISIIISCLGLYAMSMYMAERRFKEIGIRKAFGAGIPQIILMVSSDLSKLIIIAFIISIPLTIYGMNQWLNTFAFRINPSVISYLISGLVTLALAWITISYQSIRAALTNPVKVLREE